MFGCGDWILELDKLIRSDRSKLVPSNSSNNRRLDEGSYALSGGTSNNMPSPAVSHAKQGNVGDNAIVGTSMVMDQESWDGSPSSSQGKGDLRQVRLFKTRFCQYGTDCPYLVKGTCLYAHNRDEVRLRPPPPKGYKQAALSVSSSIGGPILRVDSKSERKSSAWSTSSILDCLPPRLSTEIDIGESPARHSVSSLATLTALANQVAILESAKDEIDARVTQRQVALEHWFPAEVVDESFHLVNQIGIKEIQARSLTTRTDGMRKVILRSAKKPPFVCPTLPRRSHVVKACNVQIDASHNQLSKVCSSLSLQRMHLLQEVASLYPIDYQGRFRTIRGLALPSVSALKRSNDVRDEETISTALGSLLHRIQLVANIVDFPLLLVPVIAGSRSAVKDRFSNPSLQELPLFYKGSERSKYVSAIQLLMKTLVHFAVSRGKAPENSNDLLEMADLLLVREMMPDS